MSFRAFEGTGELGTCLWCGRKLRQRYYTKRETRDLPPKKWRCLREDCRAVGKHYETKGGEHHCQLCDSYVETKKRVVTERKPVHEKLGDYGDGHFCGLRCGYDFGVAFADGVAACEIIVKRRDFAISKKRRA